MARTIAITGGTEGIGLAIAEHFLGQGDRVAVCSRSARPSALPEPVHHVQADVRSRSQVQRFLQQVLERFESVEVWINCAGISRWRPVEQIDESFAAEILETGLLGTLWGCAAASQRLKAGGSIVNISSLAGKRGSANNSAYCAAKFAVNGITQSLAKELGPKGIRVNAVCPVYVETEKILSALAQTPSPAQGQPVETYLAAFAREQTALGRLPTAQEVAQVTYFLASQAASAVTGQCINVDCGTLPQ